MATPAHARMACPEQKTPETGEQEGSDGLKNGTSLEDSDDSNSNVLVKSRVRSPASSGGNQHREMTMDSFQDGGTPQPNSRPASASVESGFPVNMDRSRLNSDFQSFNQSSTSMVNDDFRNSQENFNHGNISGCDIGFGGRGSYIGEQHGGQGIPGNTSDMTTNSQPNKMYPQYNQQQMRPGYSQPPRNMTMSPQQRPSGNQAMGGGYPSSNSQQQRFLSGPSITQQTGPTPTLNQLLQAPNSLQRYHNSYDYNSNQGMHKNMGDPSGSQYQGPNNSWGNMRGSSGYPSQMASSVYRNQGGPMPDPSMKRPYMSPGQLSSPTGAQGGAQGQYPQQYRPYSQSQPQGTPVRPSNQNYPQQGVQQYPVMQHAAPQASQSTPSSYERQALPMSTYSGQAQSQQQPQQQQQAQQQQQQQQQSVQQSQQQTSQQQQQQPPSQQQQQPSQQPPQQQQQSQQPQDVGGGTDEVSTEPPSTGGTTTPGLRNPTTPPHPVVSPHRPAPSPSGSSAGSPSMSPALGQQQSLPMPPRPSSSQSESSGQTSMTQPPMTAQGYSQQMAPPAMYGNKMHQGMMGSNTPHLSSYSSQSSGHYSQSGYHRPPSTMSMQNYGGQSQSNYPSQMQSGPNYASQTSMVRMSTHPNSVSPNFAGPTPSGYTNSQYTGSGPHPSASGYNVSNMMPPPNQYPKTNTMPPPTGGAQAAAQAAVIAAAASSGGIRQSPMYLRQHLQQKMYGNNYNSAQSTVPSSAPVSTGSQEQSAMAPPSSTSASQVVNMSQSSPLPPTVSTPGSVNSTQSSDGSLQSPVGPSGFTQTSAPSLGTPPTTVTQSISSPVPSAVTVSSPSVVGSEQLMQSPHQGRSSASGSLGPPPPPVMDEGSQASNASASSSLPEERVETPKPNSKPPMSHPPTPNTLPSPGAASMSSFHDEFESVSSPSWPRTPASPVINNQVYDHHPIKRPDGLLKLYDLSDEPERRIFLDKLIMYNEERGTPISQCPTISKQPLDLYRLYAAAKERGGFVEVMKGKLWKDIAGVIGIGASSSAAYTLRKQYIKHLLPFECKYDRGGIDPQPIINSVESSSRKKNPKNAAAVNQDSYPPQHGQMIDGYGAPYPGSYPQGTGPHPGMMPNADYPGPGHHPAYPDTLHHPGPMVNHSSSEGAMDPFSDEMPVSQQYQRHGSSDNYGYSQSNTNSGMPPYSGTQQNMSSSSFGYSNTSVSQPDPPYGEQYSGSIVPPSSESNYTSRNMVQDPYGPPPGGYPPNRTVGPTNTQYPPYQGPCDQERYDQPAAPQGPMMRPPSQSSSTMGPSSQTDSPGYSPHRYPSQQMSSRENMPPQQMGAYQGRPTMSSSQYPGTNSQSPGQSTYPQTQPESYRNPEFQNYPAGQQGMYGQSMPPPNKVAPPSTIPGNMYQREMYPMGAKRHNDYSKSHGTNQDQYHMGSYSQQQTQGPYSADRGQYPYRPTHTVPPQTPGPPQQGWPRDNRPYPSGQNQYQGNQRENWDVSRHGEGHPGSSGAWPPSRYGGPPSEPYASHMGSSVGPKMGINRGYLSPNKMPPHSGVGPPPQYTPPPPRKEIIFPPDTVEGVTPVMNKRRRLTAKDVSPLEAWRIMMCLKSGLLSESTWALDVLSVLMYDDSSVLYFGLSHLPGLLEVLMDYYRRCLNLIFDLTSDLEVGFSTDLSYKEKSSLKEKETAKWFKLERDFVNEEPCIKSENDTLSGDSEIVLDTPNYTKKTRCKKLVRTQPEETLFLFDPDKKWDVHEGFISGTSHWQHGGGEFTGYIQTHFESTEKCVRFVRLMEDVRKSDNSSDGDLSETSKEKNSVLASNDKSCDSVQCCKKECGSDTEEDEGSCGNSPKAYSVTKCSEAKEENKDEESTKVDDKPETEEQTEKLVKPLDGGDDEDEGKDENSSAKETSSEKVDATSTESSEKDEISKEPEVMETEMPTECSKSTEDTFPKLRPESPTRKRKTFEDLEEESYTRDEPSLCITDDAQDSLARRCICISSLLRNLSFVPGNDTEMSKHAGFLMVIGRLLLLHHVHPPRKPQQHQFWKFHDREEEGDSTSIADSCSSLNSEHEWWWDMLHVVRENTLVTLANIAGQLDLAPFPEEISLPILDGLMHWVTCPSSYAQDPLPTQPSQSVLSPQRLSLEALCKLSVLESNVDLMMATPPWKRNDRFFGLLVKWLSRNEDQVLREFSVVLLSNLSQADSSMARAVALHSACIPLLITFVEQAEQSALQVANSQGINALRENPELMGTTLDMVRRAAGTLRCLARVPYNRTLFLQHQQRLLALVMSQILDQGVASIIADVLFECSQDSSEDLPYTTNEEKSTSSTATT